MKLENSKGECFKLEIFGYEFPNILDDKWDSNWLEIGIEVKHSEKGTWTASRPCLLTFEVERLIKWLADLSRQGLLTSEVHPRFYGTKPRIYPFKG